uniref:RxLR effector candidate protein n=1 Tax=Hyaloperonospora arabidopsidis (strain Emoy2) TaxID=559515 RepID=M4B7X7_HYAAE
MHKSQLQLLLRVVLHVAIALLLSVRSAQLGRTLHPFQRAVANSWVHLLFYVNVPLTNIQENQNEDEAVETLPHFLLEIEEEIAANIGDEFFSGGFAARASALPVGALFTIEETRQHLHGAVDNYFRLADVALDSFVVFSNKTSSFLSPPLLTVRADVGDEARDELYNITNGSDCCDQWPAPLRMGAEAASRQETRAFLDALDAIELKFVVGMTKKDARMEEDNVRVTRVYQWTVAMRYDLLNQGHLEVTLNYNLDHVSILEGGRRYAGEEKNIPPVLLDTSVALHWVTLVVIVLFQVSSAKGFSSNPASKRVASLNRSCFGKRDGQRHLVLLCPDSQCDNCGLSFGCVAKYVSALFGRFALFYFCLLLRAAVG